MADDTSLVPVSGHRRERLRARRRRARVGSAVAIVVVLAGSASAYAFTHHQDTDSKASPGRTRSRDVAATETTAPVVTGSTVSLAPPRVLSHATPLNLWVGGDSLAGALGPALGTVAGATGVVHTQVDYMVSSGIATNDVRNWYDRATQQMAKYNPEAVVFEIGTNDASIVNSHTNSDGVPEWEPAYRMKVARMMDAFRGPADHPRTVYWVGAPTMKLGWRDKGVKELNRVAREEAAKRAPDVTYIDAYDLFAVNGEYSSTIKTLSGEYERVRIGDGVHLTTSGADYLAAFVFAALDNRWHIKEHADPSQPITWDESSGSSGNGGYSGTSGSSSSRKHHSSGSGSGSGGVTENTPAPPVSLETTAPPTVAPTTVVTNPPTSATTASPGTTAGTTGTTKPSTP